VQTPFNLLIGWVLTVKKGVIVFKNYIKIALRYFIRHKVFAGINIFGLAVGMACTILILVWVQNELSFDRFHDNADDIYLVLREYNQEKMAVSSKLLAKALREDLPEVANSTNIMPLPESFKIIIQNGDKSFAETVALPASNFFDLFSFKFKEGNPATVLADPNSAVLTEEMVKKYFGNEGALGKTLDIVAFGLRRSVKITGILKDIPSNSQLQNKIFIPMEWLQSLGIGNWETWDNQSHHTYIRLRGKYDIQDVSKKITACEIRNFPGQNKQALRYSLLPLTKIHLYGTGIKYLNTTGDIIYVEIFSLIAIIILLIASINYMNLSTALSLKRTKEVGIKKTVGADRKTLMMQFFGESLLLSFIALMFSVVLVGLFLPVFNQLSGKQLVIRYDDPYFISIAFLITLVTGLISGCYPALFLSSFQPVQILKGKLKLSPRSVTVRKGLVVFQFALSTIMIICTIVVFLQLAFIRNSNLGMDKENILCINLMGEANHGYEALKNQLYQIPDILSISRSEPMNSGAWGSTLGVSWQGKTRDDNKSFWILHTDYNLASTYKIEMSQGRFYSDQYPSDRTNAFVVNEAAVKLMGLKSPLDEEIQVWGRKGKIIGVTKDFHYASFHSPVEPLIIRIPDENQFDVFYRVISIRFKSGTLHTSLASIEKAWKGQMIDIPYEHYFYDEFLEAQYRSEQRMGMIFTYFSILSIVIACLGLFALASLSAEQRTKEIGVRKVLGATISSIATVLSLEFIKLVIISNLIAWPIAYYAMHSWLQSFAYRIEMTVWVFILSGLTAVIIALGTVSYQAIKAATANPIDSLRYE
jgi:ABC-type antimicrobial peptide transport system permease subunit